MSQVACYKDIQYVQVALDITNTYDGSQEFVLA